jgi:DNA-directed RNA polymerase II subunit RPB3
MISIRDIIKPNKNTLTFVVAGCNSSFVNAIRRVIISEVETIGFNIDDYENSDLKIIKNSSSVHNEFLLHRLGLIPINVSQVADFNPDNLKFTLKVQNTSNNLLHVTTKDFTIKNLETGQDEPSTKYFTANEITNDHILIITLKNNPTGEGEEVFVEGKCSVGMGSENSRFSPVSGIAFTNKNDKQRAQAAFEEMIGAMDEVPETKELTKLAKKFEIEESERYFMVDKNGDPDTFDFMIESVGVIPPTDILKMSIKKLIEKINNFNKQLNNALNSKESTITIRDSTCVMAGFDITIEEETHTLGFLLQTYINKLNENEHEDMFVGYMNPHPLQKQIKIRINVNSEDINVVKDIFDKTTSYLLGELNKLANTDGL